MEFPTRRRLCHAVPSWVPEGSWFFITINCVPRHMNQLACPERGPAVLESAIHQHQQGRWHCRLLLLMPDHLHAILAFPREPGLKSVITQWKRYLAAQHGVTWQRDFFDHRLRSDEELAEKTAYVLANPARRELAGRAEDWPWVLRCDDRHPPRLGW